TCPIKLPAWTGGAGGGRLKGRNQFRQNNQSTPQSLRDSSPVQGSNLLLTGIFPCLRVKNTNAHKKGYPFVGYPLRVHSKKDQKKTLRPTVNRLRTTSSSTMGAAPAVPEYGRY